MGRKPRLVGQQPTDEALGGARLAHTRRRADTRRPNRSARELVDRTRVEVVDEAVGVAVEGIRGHRRGRGGDPVELIRHDLVERRAPERMPAAVARLEMGVDEALGDGAARAIEDREHDSRRVPEVERAGVELEQVVQREPAAGDAVPGSCHVGDGRDAALERRRRQLSASVAQHRERGRVVLPQELEGGRGQRARLGGRLGQNQAA